MSKEEKPESSQEPEKTDEQAMKTSRQKPAGWQDMEKGALVTTHRDFPPNATLRPWLFEKDPLWTPATFVAFRQPKRKPNEPESSDEKTQQPEEKTDTNPSKEDLEDGS